MRSLLYAMLRYLLRALYWILIPLILCIVVPHFLVIFADFKVSLPASTLLFFTLADYCSFFHGIPLFLLCFFPAFPLFILEIILKFFPSSPILLKTCKIYRLGLLLLAILLNLGFLAYCFLVIGMPYLSLKQSITH